MTPAERMIAEAIGHLRSARDLLRAAGAKRSLARVRASLKSAEGAKRHASAAQYREERRAGREERCAACGERWPCSVARNRRWHPPVEAAQHHPAKVERKP